MQEHLREEGVQQARSEDGTSQAVATELSDDNEWGLQAYLEQQGDPDWFGGVEVEV